MELKTIVPWGRSFDEYVEMFALTSDSLTKKILGCGDGPASFNAELSEQGGNVVSVDPIYRYSAEQIRARIDEVYADVIQQVSANRDDYVWRTIANVEALAEIRMNAMRRFLEDYSFAHATGRYVNAALPTLPFGDREFDLALCSHYLFLYSEHVDREQHILSMKELCRVAKEVRVYPLLSLSTNEDSPHLGPVIRELESIGMDLSLIDVNYEFQKGATKMLVARHL